MISLIILKNDPYWISLERFKDNYKIIDPSDQKVFSIHKSLLFEGNIDFVEQPAFSFLNPYTQRVHEIISLILTSQDHEAQFNHILGKIFLLKAYGAVFFNQLKNFGLLGDRNYHSLSIIRPIINQALLLTWDALMILRKLLISEVYQVTPYGYMDDVNSRFLNPELRYMALYYWLGATEWIGYMHSDILFNLNNQTVTGLNNAHWTRYIEFLLKNLPEFYSKYVISYKNRQITLSEWFRKSHTGSERLHIWSHIAKEILNTEFYTDHKRYEHVLKLETIWALSWIGLVQENPPTNILVD